MVEMKARAYGARPMCLGTLSVSVHLGALKMLDVKMTDQLAGHEIAGMK